MKPAVTPKSPAKAPKMAKPNRNSRAAWAKSRLGRAKPQIPARLTAINAAGEIRLASTAAVPTTMPPMMETDWPML